MYDGEGAAGAQERALWKSDARRAMVPAMMEHRESNEDAGATPIACDVVVIGGGITGLSQSVAFARAGLATVCVDPAPAEAGVGEASAHLDGRTTALLQGSLNVLAACGVGETCHSHGEALAVMRIVDESGRPGGRPLTARFDSAEAGTGPFGVNVPNAALRHALVAELASLATARHLAAARVGEIVFDADGVIAHLADGRRVAARLAVGADGKGSPSRKAAGIAARRWGYGQMAMAFALTHTQPHRNISTEFHREGGPFVLVPLPGRHSSVVWVERTPTAERFLALDDPAFRAAVQARTRGVLGQVTLCGPRGRYPVESLIAQRYVAPRLALIGEAAHALPPIGAQGLNLGLSDVATLTEVVVAAVRGGADPGRLDVLAEYERQRRPDVVARVYAIDALNRAVMTRVPPLKALRHLGLAATARIAPLRAALMRQGMTPLGYTPAMLTGMPVPRVGSDHVADSPDR